MGCDIHLYVEYKKPQTANWRAFTGRLNPGRVYGLFAKLGNVRNDWDMEPIAANRGMPEDVATAAWSDNCLFISERETSESGYCTKEQAERWVRNGSSKYERDEAVVTHPDMHSHSWATTQEFEKAINEIFYTDGVFGGYYIEYLAALAAMKEFEKQGCVSRIVFFFDN